MNEMNEICTLDVSEYNIVDISPVCFSKNYICFHNIKIIRKTKPEQSEQKEENKLIEDFLVDGMTIAKYMKYNSIDIPFHFAEYTYNGYKN